MVVAAPAAPRKGEAMPTTRSTDDVEIAYRVRGEGRTDVLFMHGWAGSGRYFDETVECLDPSRLRMITFDLRGHGDSGRTDSGYTLDQLADDAVAVADAVGSRRFVLVGFSMSGKFAQYVACEHPDRVAGQVLVAGCPAFALPLPPELLADWFDREGDAARMAEIPRMYASQPIPEDVLHRCGVDAARVPLVALRGTIELVTGASFADRLAGMTAPTVVVGGRDDAIFAPEALTEGVVAPVRGARLELLDCGHEIPIERPREVAALIEEFASDLASAASQPEPAGLQRSH
jgi:pimeloyl-ACP methyl ester carboxylesterase